MTEHAADVTVEALTKSFGNHIVLDGLDLHVPAGSVTAVLGPSGCGKSTLLRILAGFDEPDSGSVRIAGTVVSEGRRSVPAHRRRVGLMPQEGALFPHRNVGGNITFGLKRDSRSKAAAVVEYWLEVVGLEGLADARPHELSGGQQQQVALARALAAEPQVLLLDEPFTALDAGLRGRVREDILGILRASRTTAILVTHDQAEALSLSDSVAVLLNGSVAQQSGPADLYRSPASLQVARFIGSTIELGGHLTRDVVHTALGKLSTSSRLPDGAVTAVVRPEQVRMMSTGVPATVAARRFYGSETSLQVLLGDGTALRLRQPSTSTVAVDERVHLQVDGAVTVFRP